MISVGTRSLLWGGHQFIIHPLAVAIAWRKLYGHWPKQLPTWVAFFAHDIGYWGLPNMDGPEGKDHPLAGAVLLAKLFDPPGTNLINHTWWEFSAGHSRYFAKEWGVSVSSLMRADKYATCLLPLWLFCLLITLSGEWKEYIVYHAEATDREAYPPTWRGVMAYARDLRRDWSEAYGPDA